MKIFFIALLGSILFTYFMPSSHAQAQRSVIVMFGDSITVGFNSTRPVRNGDGAITLNGPRQFLSDTLNNPEEPRPSTVVNWGEGGTPTSRGLQRISSNLSTIRSVFPNDRCFVLLMYGTNDFGFGLASSTTLFNTREMIRQIRFAGCFPIVGNLTPRSDRDLTSLSASIASVASSENALVVDHFSVFSQNPLEVNFELERSQISGLLIRLHPNETGYNLLVSNWFNQALRFLISPLPAIVPVDPLIISPILQLLLDES